MIINFQIEGRPKLSTGHLLSLHGIVIGAKTLSKCSELSYEATTIVGGPVGAISTDLCHCSSQTAASGLLRKQTTKLDIHRPRLRPRWRACRGSQARFSGFVERLLGCLVPLERQHSRSGGQKSYAR